MLVGVRQIEIAMKDGKGGQPGAERRRAVIALFKRDELLLRRAPGRVVVVGDEADGAVDRIGAALAEIDAGEALGRELREPRREADRRLGAEAEIAGGIGKLAHLRGRRLDHALVPVADIDAPEPGEGIKQFLARGVPHEHALGALSAR